jgi:serine protease AprX
MNLRALFVCSFAALSVSSVSLAGQESKDANTHKIDRAIRASLRAGAKSHRVIVTLEPGCTGSVRDVLGQHGDRIDAEHPLINAISGEIHSDDVEALAESRCVKSIAADAIVYADAARNSPGGTLPAALADPSPTVTNTLRDTLGLPHFAALDTSVPTGAAGAGVAIIDSGITPSVDFLGRITNFYDFTRGGVAASPYDDYGHGTHVAGLIGSSGSLSSFEFQGVAPSVNLTGLKVLDHTGAGRTSDVIKAIEFVVVNQAKLNVQIVNLSLGHPIYAPAADDPLVQAVENASAAGLIMVVSAGNFGQKETDQTVGYAGITSPGNAPSAITVGAAMTNQTVTRWDDEVAPYSSRGPSWFDGFPKPDVVAPGHHLASDTSSASYLFKKLLASHAQAASGQPLLVLSGSSMATAVTTGVAALVVQAHNQNGFHRQKPLTPNLVKAILQFSAIPIAGADYLTQGTGEINAAGAIALGRAIDTSRAVGYRWIDGAVPSFSTIGGESYYWSQRIIYGDTVLQGDPIYANNVVWGTGVVWGTLDDDNVVWGTGTVVVADDIVWGADAIWGANIVWADRVIGQRVDGTNVVWGTQIVWGTQVVWGTLSDDNVVWGTMTEDDNVVWGTMFQGEMFWGVSELPQ